MMFDPPDFPYKDLNETIKEHYGPQKMLENSVSDISLEDKVSDESHLNNNETTQLPNINNEINPSLLIVQSENLFNYKPILLDDNTVNQFLLPLQVAPGAENDVTNGPDLLALHSCSTCHEIFVSEGELLKHSSDNHIVETVINAYNENINLDVIEPSSKIDESETQWLVCGICERVLSTVLEIEPKEQLCCIVENGKNCISKRILQEMYVCEVCNALFANDVAMDRHQAICNNRNKENLDINNTSSVETENKRILSLCFSCDICGIQNISVEELKAHTLACKTRNKARRQRNCDNSKMWNCGSCNQLFATARDLYRHKRGEDRPEGEPLTAFVCEDCDKVLGSLCALHTHKKMHKNFKPGHPCRVCGRRFNQSGHLAIHMRMHTGERPYPCDLCAKAFKVKVERDDHRRTHTGERPFPCPICPKTFTAAARLREHARIHTDQRPYTCDICGAAFRRPYARTVHTLIHTGAKPHECDVCGTAFRRSGDMWKHKRTQHGLLTE